MSVYRNLGVDFIFVFSVEANAKADLSKRVVFQKPKRSNDGDSDSKKKKKKRDPSKTKQLLSFDEEDD